MIASGIKLGVNIDHIATLREVRKAAYPHLVEALFLCHRAGADQVTIHLRENRRHIQDRDVFELIQHSQLPVNLEMSFIPEMVGIALKAKPHSVTLVPERRAEMTTESGLDLKVVERKKGLLKKLAEAMAVHGFIDPLIDQVKRAVDLGLDGVEFHTGTYARLYDQIRQSKSARSQFQQEVERLAKACDAAHRGGLKVKAGHGLTVENLRAIRGLPHLEEVNIGHSIVARAVFVGLEKAIREIKSAL